MANTSVTAIVGAEDRASQAFRQIAATATEAMKSLTKATLDQARQQTQASSQAQSALAQQTDAVRRAADTQKTAVQSATAQMGSAYSNLAQKAKDAFTGIGTAAAASMSAASARIATAAKTTFDDVEKRLARSMAFGGIDDETAAKWRNEARRNDYWFRGGPSGALAAYHSQQMADVPEHSRAMFARRAEIIGTESGDTADKASEGFRAFMQQARLIKDDKGETVPISRMTFDQAEEAARRATNFFLAVNQLSAGDTQSIRMAARFGAPALASIGANEADMAALAIGMSRAGYEGDVQGNALRSMAVRLSRPNAQARAAMDAKGIKPSDFQNSNAESLSGEGVDRALRSRFGRGLGKQGIAQVDAALDKYAAGDTSVPLPELVNKVVTKFVRPKNTRDEALIKGHIDKTLSTAVSGIDIVKALDLVLKHRELGFLSTVLGSEHGPKLSNLSSPSFLADRERFIEMTQGKDLGAEAQRRYLQTPAGKQQAAEGSMKAAQDAAVEQFSPQISATRDMIVKVSQGFLDLEGNAQKAAAALVLASGALGTIAALKGLWSGLAGLARAAGTAGAAGAAGVGTGAATTGAASTSGAAGAATVGTATGAGAATGGFSMASALPVFAAAAGTAMGVYLVGEANRKYYADTQDGERHDKGQLRRRAYNEAFAQFAREERKRLEAQRAREEKDPASAPLPPTWAENARRAAARSQETIEARATPLAEDARPTDLLASIRRAIDVAHPVSKIGRPEPLSVSGTIEGKAEVSVKVAVEFDQSLAARVRNLITEMAPARLTGAISSGQTMAGSNAPGPSDMGSVAGSGAFRPTLSGY